MFKSDEDISIISEKVKLIQKKEGFRFGTDAVLLADFFDGKKTGRILEIGTGNGIIPVLLISKEKVEKIEAVEIQKEVAELAERNIVLNGFENRVKIINMDIKEMRNGNSYDYILTNPPYMVLDGKELNQNDSKTIARHEIKLNLDELISTSKKLLKPRGELFMVHKSYRFLEISQKLLEYNFSIKRVKFVHHSREKEGSLVLIEASKGRKNKLVIEPPLFLNER